MYTQSTPSHATPLLQSLNFSAQLSPAAPTPQVFYAFSQGQHELCLMISRPTISQVEDVQSGTAEFALVPQKQLLILLCRFGKQPWLWTPYQWHRTPSEHRTLPNLWNRALLQVTLIDAATDTPCVTRNILLGSEFSASLCGTILLQSSTHFVGEEAYQHALQRLLIQYPIADSLVSIATARTVDLP